MSANGYGALDEALDILKGTGPEFGPMKLSNHGPMGAEALCALGRGDEAARWAARYRRRLGEAPPKREPIGANWRAALGDFSRAGDWLGLFKRELAEAPWPQVLDRWVLRLAPGISAAAFHGVIRTGHAVRALSQERNVPRMHELAEGLAYWAARYFPLPDMRGPAGGWQPSQAIEHLEMLPDDQRARDGNIIERMAPLKEFAPFQMAANLVAADAPGFLCDLTETFARAYLANAHDIGNIIAFIHTVTGPNAVRLMEPHLSPAARATAQRYCWQAAAGIYAAFGKSPSADGGACASSEEGAPAPDELIDAAVRCGDEHAIKFTEACLREYALNPRPVYLAAARHATRALSRA